MFQISTKDEKSRYYKVEVAGSAGLGGRGNVKKVKDEGCQDDALLLSEHECDVENDNEGAGDSPNEHEEDDSLTVKILEKQHEDDLGDGGS